jgi:hypothetical protein
MALRTLTFKPSAQPSTRRLPEAKCQVSALLTKLKGA